MSGTSSKSQSRTLAPFLTTSTILKGSSMEHWFYDIKVFCQRYISRIYNQLLTGTSLVKQNETCFLTAKLHRAFTQLMDTTNLQEGNKEYGSILVSLTTDSFYLGALPRTQHKNFNTIYSFLLQIMLYVDLLVSLYSASIKVNSSCTESIILYLPGKLTKVHTTTK